MTSQMFTQSSDSQTKKLFSRKTILPVKKRQDKLSKSLKVDDQSEGKALQAALLEIDTYSDEDVNNMLLGMVNDMELPEHSKPSIFTRPLSERKDLLKIWRQKRWDFVSTGQNTQEDFVEQLDVHIGNGELLIGVLERLKVSLSTYYISWVQKFADKGGHTKLLKILAKWNTPANKDEKTKKVLLLCVRCIKTFMNNKFGLHTMLQEEEALVTLLGVLDHENENILVDMLKIAAPICLVANGHEKVLEALTEQGIRKNQDRFDPITKALNETELPLTQNACLLFVNSIISPPDDFLYRIHLRNEFVRAGLDKFIHKVSESASDDLAVQLKIYNDLKDSDFDDLIARFQGFQADMTDIYEVFKVLVSITSCSEAERYFLSILQHLLLIRDDYYVRPMYFKLIDQCVSQIVLHRTGVDPTFNYTKFDVDVEPIIDNMVTKTQVDEARERAHNYEKQLKEEQVSKHDLEVKLALMEQSLTHLKEEKAYERSYYEQQVLQLQSGTGVTVELKPPPPPNTSNNSLLTSVPEPPPNLPEVQALLPPPSAQFVTVLGTNLKIPPPPPNLPEVDISLNIQPKSVGLKRQIELPKRKVHKNIFTKRLNWSRVNEAELSSKAFWATLNEDSLENTEVANELIKMFSKDRNNKKDEEKIAPPAATSNPIIGSKRIQEPQVLPGRTCQNLSILLMSLKYPHELIKKKILSMDDSLSIGWLEQLIKYLPHKTEIAKLEKVKDRFHELNAAEQFILVITKIERLDTRLTTMHFRKKFKDEISDIVPDLRLVKQACTDIKNSQKFAKVLEYILIVGNIMNAGTANAGSYGFNLEFLTKLEDTKSVVDHTMNVMNFLIMLIEKKNPELMKFPRELESVIGASRVSSQDLKTRIRAMSSSIEDIKSELKNYKNGAKDPDDLYGNIMSEFLKNAEGDATNVRKLHKDMDEDVNVLMSWYAMDPQKIMMEDLFKYIKDFIHSFERAKKYNEEVKEKRKREEKAQKQREEMKKKLNNTKQKVQRTGVVNLDELGDDKNENVLDNLLDSLRTGRAFDKRRPKKSKPLQMDSLLLSTQQTKCTLNNIHHSTSVAIENNASNSPVLPQNNSIGTRSNSNSMGNNITKISINSTTSNARVNHYSRQSQAQLLLEKMKQPRSNSDNSESTFL